LCLEGSKHQAVSPQQPPPAPQVSAAKICRF
jgi:hypothetical protein